MSRSRPTQDEQRLLHNYYGAMAMSLKHETFEPEPQGTIVIFDVPEIKSALKEIHGDKCQVPYCDGRSKSLILEHIDGNDDNWRPENLRLACRSCNQREHKHQVPVPSGNTSTLEKEKASATKSATALQRVEAEAIARTAPIFRKSKDYKRTVRIYLSQKTATGGIVAWSTARADIIALTGMSRGKADEYLADFTESELQPFETTNKDGTDPNPGIKRREKVDYSRLPEEDRKIYEEAQELINQETAAKLEQQREEVERAALHTQALRTNETIYRQVGQWVDTETFKIRPIVYVADRKKYDSNGMDGPFCLCCGTRKAMAELQLVCEGCKTDLKGGNGKARAGAAA